MMQAVWFDAGSTAAGRLLLSIHHLAVDGVSWRILVPELAAAREAIAQGRVPARTGDVVPGLGAAACAAGQDAGRLAELSFWSGMLSKPSLMLVDGALDARRDVGGTAGHLALTLPAALTAALLTRVPGAFHGGINEVLLTGLVVALADWCRRRGRCGPGGCAARSGRARARGGVRGCRPLAHGGMVHQPVPGAARCRCARSGRGLGGGDALGRALKSIKEQLRALPDHGLGYGVLRYLNPQTAAQLSGFAAPQLGFNYLGRFAAAAQADWSVAGDAVRLGAGDAAMPLAHALEVNALTLDGAEGPALTANWSWARCAGE